jgi:integrase
MLAHPRAFNLAKSNVQAFLKATLGRRHRAYMDAQDIPALKVRATRKKHPLTADQLRGLVRNLGEPWGPMAWTMATTGMGWKEYLGAWEREGVGLRIHGTKTGGRDRLVPLVSLLHQPEDVAETTFRWHLSKGTPRITPYDLRRTYAGMMVDANIPRPRRRLYLGHAAEDISALYEAQEVVEYLVKDAEAMRRVIGEPEGGPRLQVVGRTY